MFILFYPKYVYLIISKHLHSRSCNSYAIVHITVKDSKIDYDSNDGPCGTFLLSLINFPTYNNTKPSIRLLGVLNVCIPSWMPGFLSRDTFYGKYYGMFGALRIFNKQTRNELIPGTTKEM